MDAVSVDHHRPAGGRAAGPNGTLTVEPAAGDGDDDPKLHHASCLLARIGQLKAEGELRPDSPALADAERLLQRRRLRWIDVLQAERLVLTALTVEAAELELARRLVERDQLAANVRGFYDEVAAVLRDGDDAARARFDARRLLLRLSEDLHAARIADERKRRQLVALRRRKVWCFLVGFAFFLTASAVFVYASVKTAELGDPMPGWLWWLKAVADPIVAVSAGLFGAAFSMLRHREPALHESECEAVEQASAWSSLCARLWAGVGGAMVLYYVLLTGFVDVPMLDSEVMREALTVKGPPGTIANHAALTVVCFVAGFSERLVPGVIDRVVGKVGTPRASDPV
jgi:hypothetical protein